jgi:ABC-type phosphate transport system substrate-binding protein
MKRVIGLLLALAMSSGAYAASFKVVVNDSVKARSLSKTVASDYFLKKAKKWDDGSAVVPVDQIESSAVREQFSRAVHGKPTSAIKSYWTQQIFSGRDVPPVEKKSDAEVLAYVKANPGAIGYVADTTDTDGLRVVTVE